MGQLGKWGQSRGALFMILLEALPRDGASSTSQRTTLAPQKAAFSARIEIKHLARSVER
jgi:hypothetical protein